MTNQIDIIDNILRGGSFVSKEKKDDCKIIALMGAPGTGKTTNLPVLAERLGRSVQHEIARLLVPYGFNPGLKSTGDDRALQFFTSLLLEEEFPDSIFDRCALDAVVHLRVLAETLGIDRYRMLADAMLSCCDRFLHDRYVVLFHLIQGSAGGDGFRETSERYRTEVETQTRNVLNSLGIKYTCLTGPNNRQVETAIDFLAGL